MLYDSISMKCQKKKNLRQQKSESLLGRVKTDGHKGTGEVGNVELGGGHTAIIRVSSHQLILEIRALYILYVHYTLIKKKTLAQGATLLENSVCVSSSSLVIRACRIPQTPAVPPSWPDTLLLHGVAHGLAAPCGCLCAWIMMQKRLREWFIVSVK